MTAVIKVPLEAMERNEWRLNMHGPTSSLGGLFRSLVQFRYPNFIISWRVEEHLMLDAVNILDPLIPSSPEAAKQEP